EDDWRKIQTYVRQGRAHELSEGSTMYLAACTKGAGGSLNLRSQPRNSAPARQRAFSLKSSFLTRAIEGLIRSERARQDETALVAATEELAAKTVEEVALERLHRYRGWTVVDIWRELDPSLNLDAKGIYADLARRMLGVKSRRIEKFEKAGGTMKIVRLQRNGKAKESMSSPAFKLKDLAQQTWRKSDLREQFNRRFLFVFFS